MIQLHIGPQTLVITLQEVFGAPDPNSAIISTGGQILPITTKIKARHIPTVALQKCKKRNENTTSKISLESQYCYELP